MMMMKSIRSHLVSLLLLLPLLLLLFHSAVSASSSGIIDKNHIPPRSIALRSTTINIQNIENAQYYHGDIWAVKVTPKFSICRGGVETVEVFKIGACIPKDDGKYLKLKLGKLSYIVLLI